MIIEFLSKLTTKMIKLQKTLFLSEIAKPFHTGNQKIQSQVINGFNFFLNSLIKAIHF